TLLVKDMRKTQPTIHRALHARAAPLLLGQDGLMYRKTVVAGTGVEFPDE
ncbi:hypothetical protein BaRGS_00036590, partial [Batillaria attramentaria]